MDFRYRFFRIMVRDKRFSIVSTQSIKNQRLTISDKDMTHDSIICFGVHAEIGGGGGEHVRLCHQQTARKQQYWKNKKFVFHSTKEILVQMYMKLSK